MPKTLTGLVRTVPGNVYVKRKIIILFVSLCFDTLEFTQWMCWLSLNQTMSLYHRASQSFTRTTVAPACPCPCSAFRFHFPPKLAKSSVFLSSICSQPWLDVWGVNTLQKSARRRGVKQDWNLTIGGAVSAATRENVRLKGGRPLLDYGSGECPSGSIRHP